ncbi:MAG TPA: hypothetical protein VFW89_04150 [Gemmatimonadaceae bacterium]|nr:hypothetical protein [Gemmatimonadaceae bacterium]
MNPQRGKPWCFRHDPERAEANAAASVLGGKRRRKPHPVQGPPSRLRSMDDVLTELEQALDQAKGIQVSSRRITALVRVLTAAITAQTNAVRIMELLNGIKGVDTTLVDTIKELGLAQEFIPEAEYEAMDEAHLLDRGAGSVVATGTVRKDPLSLP